MLILTIVISLVVSAVFIFFQHKYFLSTRKAKSKFENFFPKDTNYSWHLDGEYNGDPFPQLDIAGKNYSNDLDDLIREINTYLRKTRGTSDYEFIRNKVERRLNALYDDATARLAFPTYCGLMGTFAGVLIGIIMFLIDFNTEGSISDDSIRNLLSGVIVSMATSFLGLFLTTWNNSEVSDARKGVEDAKNKFYDFIQTEITKTASASLVTAISKLHDTVDKFEPAFSTIIEGFKSAFNECTRAFGDDFKRNVQAVNSAVIVMGENMDKINENIDLQKKLLDTFKSNDLVRGLEKYVEAANHFVSITLSLNKFEEARRLMLAAAQEAIALQNQYNESLKVPREIAVRVNQILDRIKDFEENVKAAGRALNEREILGNDVINKLRYQIEGISKKGKIADKYLELADGKLEDLFKQQTEVISEMNKRYKEAIEGHIEGFEEMFRKQTEELESRHKIFMDAIEERFSVEDVRKEFTNLGKLNEIEAELTKMASTSVTPENIKIGIENLQKELRALKNDIKPELESINKNTKERKGGISLFGRG